jgi:hypothetical protein
MLYTQFYGQSIMLPLHAGQKQGQKSWVKQSLPVFGLGQALGPWLIGFEPTTFLKSKQNINSPV